jgi:hypothetical protein
MTGATPQSGSSAAPRATPSRKRLRELLANHQQRAYTKKGKTTVGEATMTPGYAERVLQQSDEELYRKLDAEIRWDSFNYHSNKFSDHIIKRVYGVGIDVQGDVYLAARAKVQDNIKSYKNKMLTEVRNHVANVRKNYLDLVNQSEDEVADHFESLFNESNYLKCWYYMSGYIDFEGCTTLGKYFMSCKSPPALWLSVLLPVHFWRYRFTDFLFSQHATSLCAARFSRTLITPMIRTFGKSSLRFTMRCALIQTSTIS